MLKIYVLILFLFVRISAEAGFDGINIQREKNRLSNYSLAEVAKDYAHYICELSLEYKVPASSIASILSRQYFHYSIEDTAQDLIIGSGSFFSQKDQVNLQKLFNDYSKQDQKLLLQQKNFPARNSKDSYLFSSIGPAQIQIYLGLQIAQRWQLTDYEASENINLFSEFLSSKRGSLLVLSLELREFIEIYQEIANSDISRNVEALWQLHNMGSPIQRAYARKNNGHQNKKIDGVDNAPKQVKEYFQSIPQCYL